MASGIVPRLGSRTKARDWSQHSAIDYQTSVWRHDSEIPSLQSRSDRPSFGYRRV